MRKMKRRKTASYDKAKILILLSLSLVIQSLSSVFIKFAGQYETLSREFSIFYVLAIGCLGIYAIMWQFLLELIPLTTAYLRKGILYPDSVLVRAVIQGACDSEQYYRKHYYYSGDQSSWNG